MQNPIRRPERMANEHPPEQTPERCFPRGRHTRLQTLQRTGSPIQQGRENNNHRGAEEERPIFKNNAENLGTTGRFLDPETEDIATRWLQHGTQRQRQRLLTV